MVVVVSSEAQRSAARVDDRPLRQALEYPLTPLHRLLAETAARRPDSTALVFFGRRTTYRELLHEVKLFAGGLATLGLKTGDRVAVMLPNCPQAVAAYYGTLWAGGIAVMLNPLYTPRELNLQLKDSGARYLVVLDLLGAKALEAIADTSIERVVVTGIRERLPLLLGALYPIKLKLHKQSTHVPAHPAVMSYGALLGRGSLETDVPVDPAKDPALLQYTGGTTGLPKAAMLTHQNLAANCIQLRAWLPELSVDQVTILGVIPFFHVYGMTTVMNFGIMTGARIVLLPRFTVADVLKSIRKYRPQLFPGVPAMYAAINNHPGIEKYDLSSIEYCISGAAALPLKVKEAFEQLTGGRLVEGYGLTEASPVTNCNPLRGVQKAGSIGLPMPDTECRIVDPATGAELPADGIGELVIKGPQVMKGYWNRPEETAQAFRGGWLHTGDMARIDADGYAYIVDRIKEMIIVSGYNVFPREVEEVLFQHPAVREAAAIGVPDDVKGEVVKAFVVLKDGAQCTAQEIVEWSKKNLAPYKVPKQIEFVSELPKSLIGKVLRRVLADKERASARAPGVGAQVSPRYHTR